MDIISKIKSAFPTMYFDDPKKNISGKEIIQIPVHAIKPNPYQPRRNFDSDAIESLCESIKKYGVIQPITVRQTGENSYELIAGERRLRASTMAGLLKIPAITVNLDDNDSAVVALIENIQRENLSFMEEADAYRNLLSLHGFTQEELALKLGKTQSAVANKVRLLKLPMVVREIIKDNALSERHARALLRLSGQEKQLKALEKITDRNLNVRQTEELVEDMLKGRAERKTESKPLNGKCSLKDVRIFVNTVKHAISVMQDNGIDAESTETEFDDYYEYVVRIAKPENIPGKINGDIASV